MNVRVEKSNFEPTEPGSFFTLGAETPRDHVIMLHGAGSNAEKMERHAQKLLRRLPDTKIMLSNGINDYINLKDAFRHKEPGKGFVHGFEKDEEWQEYNKDFPASDPIITYTNVQKNAGSHVHLFGTSAGGREAAIRFLATPLAYSSLSIHGIHIWEGFADDIIQQSKNNPEIKDIPLQISEPVFDPFFRVNAKEGISKRFAKRSSPTLRSWGGKYKLHQEHKRAIRKLKLAGFEIDVKKPFFASHLLVDENMADLAQNIQYSRAIEKIHTPDATLDHP